MQLRGPGARLSHDALAVGDTELLGLTRQDFHRLLAAYPDGLNSMLQVACAKLRVLFENAERVTQAPLDAEELGRLSRSEVG